MNECPTCKSKGFDRSVLGPHRCTFCDGSEGGNPPKPNECEKCGHELEIGDWPFCPHSEKRKRSFWGEAPMAWHYGFALKGKGWTGKSTDKKGTNENS